MKNIIKLFLVLCLLVLPCIVMATGNEPVLKTDTLAVVYLDAVNLFNFYTAQAVELIKPENKAKLAEIEQQFKNMARVNVKLVDFFKNIDEFIKSELFLPDGAIWFSIDASYRPTFAFKAKVKPLELFDYLEKRFGKANPEPVKKEKDLVEFSIPAPDFKLVFSLRPDGVFLKTDGEPAAVKDSVKWDDLLKKTANKDALLIAEVDLKGIKNLVSQKNANSMHSACFVNLRILSAALEMYAMDHDVELKTLDQKILQDLKYLNCELKCSAGGAYSLDGDKEVMCIVHGTVKKPTEASSASDHSISAQFRPFENVRLKISKTDAELATMINDKNLLEQWVAIGKQQLLAIRSMAENQMGQLPEVDRKKGLQMLDSIKIAADGMCLKISLVGLDEKTMISGVVGVAGVVSAIAIPNFAKARDNAREKSCRANCRVTTGALEMYEMDNVKPMETLDFGVLVEKQYLKSEPVCPDGGKYSLRREDNAINIDCSFHKAR